MSDEDSISIVTVGLASLILIIFAISLNMILSYYSYSTMEINLKINDVVPLNSYFLELVTINETTYEFNIWVKNGDSFLGYSTRTLEFHYKSCGIYPIGRDEWVLVNESGTRDGPFKFKPHIDGGFIQWLMR